MVPATAAPGVAQPRLRRCPAQEMVVDVRIAGNKSLPLDKILPHIRTRAGRPFDLELIEEDVRRLDHTAHVRQREDLLAAGAPAGGS